MPLAMLLPLQKKFRLQSAAIQSFLNRTPDSQRAGNAAGHYGLGGTTYEAVRVCLHAWLNERGHIACQEDEGGLAGNVPGIQSRQSGQIMTGSRMPAARQRKEVPVAGSSAGDRQSQGLPPYLPHPQYLSAISRVLKKVVQGGTGVANSVPLFRLIFIRWYSAKSRLARLYHLSHPVPPQKQKE
ncbi:hypothetical protein BJP35_1250 [Enterobacter sp. J49]|nr:hypothetical protein ABR30_0200445 [Enterobacter ludwigii]OUC38376.1 hypothetical protein BJP35_1250 [Enterobacter sp. J49]